MKKLAIFCALMSVMLLMASIAIMLAGNRFPPKMFVYTFLSGLNFVFLAAYAEIKSRPINSRKSLKDSKQTSLALIMSCVCTGLVIILSFL